MSVSPRLNLPMLAAGQAQKELTHNEALLLLDFLVQPTCSAGPSNVPPASPSVGKVFLCGSNPTGVWSGRANHLAFWTESGWRFAAAFEGLEVSAVPGGFSWRYSGGAWISGVVEASSIRIEGIQVLGQQGQAIASPAGGSVIDVEARASLASILEVVRAHGLIAS